MSDRSDFLGSIMPRQTAVETAMHNGDVQPRLEMWSHKDPVTLFGARFSASGWNDVSAVFHRLGGVFENCEAYEIELVAADASGDLAYTVAYEHTTATVNGVRSTYTLRVTHVYRRENGEWKVVHRHGDQPPEND